MSIATIEIKTPQTEVDDRVTADRLTRALLNTSLQLGAGDYMQPVNHIACPLSVLYADRFGSLPDFADADPEIFLSTSLGLNPLYVRGLINGFDDPSPNEEYLKVVLSRAESEIEYGIFLRGYEDGKLLSEEFEPIWIGDGPDEDDEYDDSE